MRSEAEAVVIGGGVGGCSIAYHLAKRGVRHIQLIEQHDLTDGTTWHSAGFVGQLRSTIGHTRMMMYSAGLYAELERATGLDPGWRGVGGLRLASSRERVEELKRQAGLARTYGLAFELLTPREARERCPLLDVKEVHLAAWLPGDGYLDPERLTAALAVGARRLGADIATRTRVTGIEVEAGRVTGVTTDGGSIAAPLVVNAAGVNAPAIGRMACVSIPSVAIQHQYLETEPLDPPLERMTTVRDPDRIVYFRQKDVGLLGGGYARRPARGPDALPEGPRRLLAASAERFEESLAGARRLVPALADARVARWVNGLESFTPDGEFILGESEVNGFWVATGFCVHGLAGAGGVGKAIAEWIVDGAPEWDVTSMSLSRLGAHHRSDTYARERSLEAYSKYYDIVYPAQEMQAGRPLRLSPAYPRLVELAASFGEKAGWERANWFDSNAASGEETLRPRGWAGRFWSPAIGAEHHACRTTAALFDETSFAKLEVSGPGAAAFLERLCDNRVARAVGAVTYTQMLNERGGIECDFTITRLGEERFRIVTGTAFGEHDLAWIRSHAPTDGSVWVDDVTSRYACLGLWGPHARDILQPLSEQDLSSDSFKYMRAREIALGRVPCLALRVTYVGELGWELYCHTELGLALWDLLWESGRGHGMVAGGYRAIDSLRLEKGYLVWGADVTPDESPWEAGIDFAVKLDKGDFLGREALVAAKERPLERKLVCLLLDEPHVVVSGSEPVRLGGRIAGRVTTGGYGHTVERSIAYAYVPPDEAEPGNRVEIEVFGEWIGAEVAQLPLYDPDGKAIRS
ncbi:FAD-dependent oxidoreductase [soil metagenome]